VDLVTRAATTGATGTNHQITLPFTTPSGNGYRIRVLSSAPTTTSNSNGVDLTINGLTLGTPTITTPVSTFTFCTGEGMTVNFSNSCAYSNTGFNNVLQFNYQMHQVILQVLYQ